MGKDREQVPDALVAEALMEALTQRWTLAQVRQAHEAQVEAQLAYEAAHATAVLAYIRGSGVHSDAAAYAHATLAVVDQRRALLQAEVEREQAAYGYVKAAPVEESTDA